MEELRGEPGGVFRSAEFFQNLAPSRLGLGIVLLGVGHGEAFGVLATQLWHQFYIDPNLAELPRARVL